jgi:hypothetical protein
MVQQQRAAAFDIAEAAPHGLVGVTDLGGEVAMSGRCGDHKERLPPSEAASEEACPVCIASSSATA